MDEGILWRRELMRGFCKELIGGMNGGLLSFLDPMAAAVIHLLAPNAEIIDRLEVVKIWLLRNVCMEHLSDTYV